MQKITRSYIFILAAIALGVITALSGQEILLKGADAVATLFMNFLKMIAAPIVFLSITSTLSGMRAFQELRLLGKKVFGYTLLTTLLATAVALFLFLLIDPVSGNKGSAGGLAPSLEGGSYLSFFLNILPENLIRAFLDNNVIAIAFVAFLLGIAALKLEEESRQRLHGIFSAFFKLMLKTTEFIITLMPVAVWAFTTQLILELRAHFEQFSTLMLFLGCVLGANLVQGFVVLPLLLKLKGLSPWKIARGASRALMLAFFSKSSNATLPVSMKCAEGTLGISSKVAHFSLPLCTVINMNGCAAFILTTVLFVCGVNGHLFTPFDLGIWMILATVAAIGNAGVPMGCFFLSSAFLIHMNVPLAMLGLILPFYTFLDMVETALNVWSDLCVTAIVDKEVRQKETVMALN